MTGGRWVAMMAALLLAACAPAPVLAPVENIGSSSPAPVPQDLPEPVGTRPDSHLVLGGETLIAIAFNYGLNYRDLALWNNLRDPDLIEAGQRLRLNPPKNEPEVAVVGKKATPSLRATNGEAVPTTAATQKRQTTIISATVPAVTTEDVPFKTAPLAAKYIYSPVRLADLRRLAAVSESAAQKAPTLPTTPSTAATSAPNAPTAVRQRFDIEWSWPTTGRMLEKYSEVRRGVTFIAEKGAPVFASADGKVIYVGTSVNSYGRLVVIQHGNDYLSAYAHNDEILVREGEQVKRGSRIATFGASGAERVMLHFEVRKAGKPFDPFQVLPAAK